MLHSKYSRPARKFSACVLVITGAFIILSHATTVRAATKKPLPSFQRVEDVVNRHFEAIEQWKPGFLIRQQYVEPLFKQLTLLGWPVKDKNRIMKLVPKDHDFLVQLLLSPHGRRFMEKSMKYPNVYDRLDNVIKQPGGRELVSRLTKLPDGYKYMSPKPTPGFTGNLTFLLPNRSTEVSQKPSNKTMNRPTGRIYTKKMLIEELEKSYEKTKKLMGKSKL